VLLLSVSDWTVLCLLDDVAPYPSQAIPSRAVQAVGFVAKFASTRPVVCLWLSRCWSMDLLRLGCGCAHGSVCSGRRWCGCGISSPLAYSCIVTFGVPVAVAEVCQTVALRSLVQSPGSVAKFRCAPPATLVKPYPCDRNHFLGNPPTGPIKDYKTYLESLAGMGACDCFLT
jgi:hypothetical protein